MTVTVAGKLFAAALAKVQAAIKPKIGISLLACARVAVTDGVMSIEGTDKDIMIRATLPADGEVDPVCVDAARLAAVLARLRDRGDLTIELEDTAMRIKSGRSRLTLDTLKPVGWPELDQDIGEPFAVDAGILLSVVTALAPAICTLDDRVYLNGIFLQRGSIADAKADGHLVAIASDGRRMAIRHFETQDVPAKMPDVIVPRAICLMLSKLFDGVPKLHIGLSDRRILITGGDVVVVSKLIEGTYPDWRRIVPVRPATHSYDTDALIAAVAIAASATLPGKNGHAVKLIFGADETEIRSDSLPTEGRAEGQDAVAHNVIGETDCEYIGVSADYLAEMLEKLGAETAEISVLDAGSPIVLTAAAHDDRKTVIMPMRVA